MKNYKFIIASAMLALGTSAVAQATYVDKDAMSINSRSTSTPIFGEVDSIHWARLSSRTYSLLIFRELLAINSLRFSDSVLR